MTRDAGVLSGPIASGEDAITRALSQISPRYVLFQKLKAGAGRRAGYRLMTLADVERMRGLGLILYANASATATSTRWTGPRLTPCSLMVSSRSSTWASSPGSEP
jgi:hypothetical protein